MQLWIDFLCHVCASIRASHVWALFVYSLVCRQGFPLKVNVNVLIRHDTIQYHTVHWDKTWYHQWFNALLYPCGNLSWTCPCIAAKYNRMSFNLLTLLKCKADNSTISRFWVHVLSTNLRQHWVNTVRWFCNCSVPQQRGVWILEEHQLFSSSGCPTPKPPWDRSAALSVCVFVCLCVLLYHCFLISLNTGCVPSATTLLNERKTSPN